MWQAHGTRRLWNAAVLLALIVAVSMPASGVAEGTSTETEATTLQSLQAQVDQLKAEIEALQASRSQSPEEVAELERRIDLLADELERIKLGEAETSADTAEHGLGPAASKVYHSGSGVSIGGYGEFLYQNYRNRDDGAPGPGDTIDALRAVLYFGYKFNDRYLFNSEVEFEHAGASDERDGEAAVEFAYLDMLRSPAFNVRAGLLLIPMGFINELHEPTVYLSAQRPEVERQILPSTWRELGAGIFGDVGPVSYRTYIVNGLDASGFEGSGLRDGRQDGSEAKAEDFAWVGRADWTARPGLVLGASAWVGNSGQGLKSESGRRLGVSTRIFEAHLEWRWRGLQARGLFATATLSDTETLNAALGLSGEDAIGRRLDGGYVELGYDLFALHPHGAQSLTPFVRYETLKTQAAMAAGLTPDPANDRDLLTFGVAWKPMERLVVKTDYRNLSNKAGTGQDQFNVALGYVF